MAQPEAYIGSAASLFDEAGNLTNQGTKDFLTAFGKAFQQHIALHTKKAA